MLDLDLLGPEGPRGLRRSEYDQLVRLGAFDDERVELLHGTIVKMSPNNPAHAGPITRLTGILVPALVGRADVRVQLPFWAVGDSEPEPDLAVVPRGPWNREHPESADLVIEVAASSLRKDRAVKAPLYAASSVTEYWVVNVIERTVEVFRDSDGTSFLSESRHGASADLRLIAFPDVVVRVGEIFG